jgi:hypothetical protein
MYNNRSLVAGIVSALVFAGWLTPSYAQTAPPAPGGNVLGQQCNILRDLVPADPKDPNSFDSTKLTTLDEPRKKTLLTSGLPCAEILSGNGPQGKTLIENLQRGFDFYSWLTFIALNSPAENPKGIETSRADMQTVWEDGENFKPLLDVMLPGGATPEWKEKVIPPACQSKYEASNKRLMVVKMIEESFNQPFKTGPLIDQRNNYAIFDILMNRVMFEYVAKHNLYSRVGQASDENSNLRIDFPSANNDKNEVGAIMLKVSWKILTPEDDKRKFHHVEALVAMPSTDDGQIDPPCLQKTLGLVGFHVVHKTVSRPQWIWTSFEHVDNVPEEKEVVARDSDPIGHKLKSSYNFYDPSCHADECPANETPPRPWDPDPTNELQFRRTANGSVLFNSQIVRKNSLTDDTNSINDQFHAILGKTVWNNYMLIGTQWPSATTCTKDQSLLQDAPSPFTDFDKQPDMNCAPTPIFLANSTLETFSQGEVPLASSSCMACHGNATSYLRTQIDPKKPKDAKEAEDRKGAFMSQSDFTFMLEKAR